MCRHRRWIAAFVSLCVLSGGVAALRAQDDSAQQPAAQSPPLPLTPIADVLADRNGDTIPDRLSQHAHVRGVVTIGSGVIADDRTQIYIQDGTGGLYLFSRRALEPAVKAGDVVDVTGEIDQYRGSVQLLQPRYTIVGHDAALPAPIRTTVREAAGWRYYGRLIEVEGTVAGEETQGVNLAFRLEGDKSSIDLVIPPKIARAMPVNDLQPGTHVTATGVAGIYSLERPYNNGFRILVASPGAVKITGRPLPQWARTAVVAVPVALVVAAAAVFLVFLARRSKRHRQRELAVLSEVSGTVATSGTDVISLVEAAVQVMSRHKLIDGAMVHLVADDQLQLCGTFGVESEIAREVDEQIRTRISAPLVRRDSVSPFTLPALHPLVCVPLHGRSRAVGLLTAFTSRRHTPTPEEASTIAAVANVVAMGIESIQILEEAELQQNELKQLAITDPLTGLYNRRFLDEYLRIHIAMARRQSAPVGFIAIDLDRFKDINDTCGHEVGDAVLREFGATVRRLTRASDLPVRLGGEEFLVVMPDTGESGAVSFAKRLQEELKRADFARVGLSEAMTLTASFGIALYPDHGEQVNVLLRMADDALYESKRNGRDLVTVAPMPFRLVEA